MTRVVLGALCQAFTRSGRRLASDFTQPRRPKRAAMCMAVCPSKPRLSGKCWDREPDMLLNNICCTDSRGIGRLGDGQFFPGRTVYKTA